MASRTRKVSGAFEKRAPGRMKADKGRIGGGVGNQQVLILTVCYFSIEFITVRKTMATPSYTNVYLAGETFRERKAIQTV